MIRLVAFDLDGTVLNGTNQASVATLEVIRALLDRGIGVASVSGRNVDRSQIPFAEYPEMAAAMYVGSYNGAVVLGPGGDGPRPVLHEERLPREGFLDLVRYVDDREINYVYCRCEIGEDGIDEVYLSDRETKMGRAVEALTGMRYVYDGDLSRQILSGELGVPPKIMVLPDLDRLDRTLADLGRLFDGKIYVAWAKAGRVEVMHPAVNKSIALNAIAGSMDASMAEVLAVGDGNNDLPMLREAGVGVLMGDADAATRQAVVGSDIRIGRPFTEDGFAAAVRKFALNG